MIVKVNDKSIVQLCPKCKNKVEINYEDLTISNKRLIRMPKCEACNSIEILFLNNRTDEHGQKVSRVFANVNASK